MSPRLPILAVLLVLGGSLCAADADPKLAGYHLKNRSSFSTTASQERPPFWPIGWVHHAKGAATVVEAKPVINAEMFSVTSILLGPSSLALINGRAYGEGDILHPPRAGSKDGPKTAWPANVHVRVQKIADGSVTLVSDSQTLSVPLRRAELNEHKSDKADEDSLSN